MITDLHEQSDPFPPSQLQPASQTTAALPGTSQALAASGNPLQKGKRRAVTTTGVGEKRGHTGHYPPVVSVSL